MAVLLASTIGPPERWSDPLAAALTGEELRVYPDMGNPDDIDVALFARQQPGLFPQLRNLRLIIGLQAGVESLLDDAELPADIPIVRSTQPDGDRMIAEYVLMHVLRHHRNMPDFLDNQRDAKWEKPPVLLASERRVGFMGLGVIAHPCVVLVRDLGFQTASWTRTPNDMDGVENFHGAAGLEPFLNRSDIMVNVLPLTTETEDILDTRTLAMLPEDAKIINIGRGQHIVDEDLMAALEQRGIEKAFVTLHVGAGTFLPVKASDTGDHVMHAEWGEIDQAAADNINRARAAGGKVVPVGSTSLRLLESAADEQGVLHPFTGETDIFITPGYSFKITDKMVTNFHLPKSTLFMLIAALAGTERVKAAYSHAIKENYRFFSYGDATLIEPCLIEGSQ